MVKRLKTCCVPRSIDKTSSRFNIPTDKFVRKIWVERIRNDKLVLQEDLQNFRVCKLHFADVCFEESGCLRKYSLPTLNLSDYKEPSLENCFFLPRTTDRLQATPEKVKKILKNLHVGDVIAGPSTSKPGSPVLKVKEVERVYEKTCRRLTYNYSPVK
ncbi:unnamed protein product [Brassicogethes aeneus]|uniref:THAP-type domain-containing protein n=1 Tax=Brassicogethes aeneus TaxID=1431903 RepID=A0A9P0F9N9_BRAAE|nr:unnamed protein product [Brassicogethes aeneus]